jgi:hypothetical protein
MPKESLSETRLIRASSEQTARWKESAERAGYWSMSEWIRDSLDGAAGVPHKAEVVTDEKAIAIYLPDRQLDRRPYVIELARCEAPGRLVEALSDLSQRAWCTPELLRVVITELAKAWKQVAEPPAKGSKK